MKIKHSNMNLIEQKSGNKEKSNFPACPMHHGIGDIYRKSLVEMDINPDNISKINESRDCDGLHKEKDFSSDVSGSEADDDHKFTGNKDDENNHYYLGGDDYQKLHENKGE
jgi:hypothetical protein